MLPACRDCLHDTVSPRRADDAPLGASQRVSDGHPWLVFQTFAGSAVCLVRRSKRRDGGTLATVGKAKGSVSEFDAMFREHYPRLVRSLSVAGDGAADAVQEAFVQALLRWRTIGRYDDPVGWVRHVALRRMLNEHRSRRRRDAAVERLWVHQRDSRAEIADVRDAPDEQLIALIVALPRRQRIAVALRYYDDLPVAEVAEAMGISEGAVRYHLHEARRRLRAVLGTIDV